MQCEYLSYTNAFRYVHYNAWYIALNVPKLIWLILRRVRYPSPEGSMEHPALPSCIFKKREEHAMEEKIILSETEEEVVVGGTAETA